MFTTNHAKQRFIERVKCDGLPRKTKQRNRYIESYLKKAYSEGLTPKQIHNQYLREYMIGKMNSEHTSVVNKITHYKNNLFLFHNRTCITILDVPETASECINNAIYITKLKSFISQINEKQSVKRWLSTNLVRLDGDITLKKGVLKSKYKCDYHYLMNNFPLNAVKYIKNDIKLKSIIKHTNDKRNINTKNFYYFICALLLLIPKNQIIKLQNILKNNNKSLFNVINNKTITRKHVDTCYRQLFILLGGNLTPKYKKFNVNDNLCYDLINDYFSMILQSYILEVKKIFKEIS